VALSALLVAVGLGASGAQAAAAQGEVTIEIGAPVRLRALVLVTVPVRVTCPAGYTQLEGSSAPIEQAAGNAIAHANVTDSVSPRPFVCDGTPRPVTFTGMADPSGPPFRAGDAAIRITLQLCNENFECVSGDSGFQVVQLRVFS
jgi:hypothetical protein